MRFTKVAANRVRIWATDNSSGKCLMIFFVDCIVSIADSNQQNECAKISYETRGQEADEQ